MSVPDFVSLLYLDEDVLTYRMDLHIESGIFSPCWWEELVYIFEGLVERDYLHEEFYFFC